MKVVILSKGKIENFNIIDSNFESYSITFKDFYNKNKHITFKKIDEVLYFSNNDSINIIGNNNISEGIIIKPGINFSFTLNGDDHIYNIYIIDSKKSFTYLCYDTALSIGNDATNQISLKTEEPFKIEFFSQNNENYYRSSGRIFCNNLLIQSKKLAVGDTLFFYGLEFIWMKNFFAIRANNNDIINSITNLEKYDNTFNRIFQNQTANIESIYKENDFFYHIPRMRESYEIKEIEIDAPPVLTDEEKIPTWVNSLTRITMLSYAFIRGYNVYEGIIVNKEPISSHITSIAMCLGAIIGSIIAPLIINFYRKKIEKEYKEKRFTTFTAYLEDKERIILNEINNQKQSLFKENLAASELLNSITTRNNYFWSKRYSDNDFLTIRLGIGEISTNLNIKGPERHFSIDKDELLEAVFTLEDKYKKVSDAPIIYSLKNLKVSSIISTTGYNDNFVNQMILQLITSHSPLDLKILIYTDEEKLHKWNYIRTIPHIFNDNKTLRYLVDNDEFAIDVYNSFVDIIKANEPSVSDIFTINKQPEKSDNTYYLIITDNINKYKNDPLINYVLSMQNNANSLYSLLIIDETMKNIPADCTNFIKVGDDYGITLDTNVNSQNQFSFLIEKTNFDTANQCSRILSAIPVTEKNEESKLPTTISFLNMYDVSMIEQLNIKNRWTTNNPVNSLSAIVGVHKNGDKFKLNLHEKNHGPHGLIAGSTGSGKSEFIITYILAMALEYHPNEVQFVLIDYKGGGLAGAFENKETGIRLPHLVGTITNLDISEMNRTLVSIKSEIKRRQIVFNECREKLNESTIDIYKYQQFYRDGLVNEPLSHLFIISDEFAELKSQRPEFMTEIISIARIGRSLGIHLILATQKPTGVVNEQIWSNSKFKVCLKVQNKSDSMEMLKKPDAASIKETGRFYLQVGYDEYFDIGQSGWAGTKYIPSDNIITKVDNSIVFINNIGTSIKNIKSNTIDNTHNEANLGDELTNLVSYIHNLGKMENIIVKNLWLDVISDKITLDELYNKYNYTKDNQIIKAVIGEYDIPQNQDQKILTLNLTEKGNTLLFGQNGSGKDMHLSTILYSTMTLYSSEVLNYYIIDCYSQVLKKFKNFPHVGGVLTVDDTQLIEDLLLQLLDEIEFRKNKFVDYGGNYINYSSESSEKLPLIVLIIHGFEIFNENFANQLNQLINITRDGEKLGISTIISFVSVSSLKSKLGQNFNNYITLQLQNSSDYRTILNCDRNLLPKKNMGRGLVKIVDESFEFQSASITLHEELAHLKNVEHLLNQNLTHRAKKIISVPPIVNLSMFDNIFYNNTNVPIGIDIRNRKIKFFDFVDNNISTISYKSLDSDKISFLNALVKSVSSINNNKVIVIDISNIISPDIQNVISLNDNYSSELFTLLREFQNSHTYIFFIGMSKKIEIDKKMFDDLGNYLNDPNYLHNVTYIFADIALNMNSFLEKNIMVKNYNRNNGIWLGPDIAMQSTYNIKKIDMQDKNLSTECIAFSIQNKNYNVIKHLVEDDYE